MLAALHMMIIDFMQTDGAMAHQHIANYILMIQTVPSQLPHRQQTLKYQRLALHQIQVLGNLMFP